MIDAPSISISKTADFCRNFPQEPQATLTREALFQYVAQLFSASSKMILIEGEPLSGKSEFLAEYMRRNPLNAVGVFLSAGENYFYTPEYVKLVLGEQIHWLVNGVQANFETVEDSVFTRLLLQLQKRGKHNPITFVIDGLGELNASSDGKITKEILKLFPFSQTEFRFLISGSEVVLGSLELDRYKPKDAPLLPINTDEAILYFPDIDVGEVKQIRHFCRGVIGEMARFRDLLSSGVPITSLLDEKEGTLKKLLDFEWNLIPDEPGLSNLLGYVIFSARPLTTLRLSSLCHLNVEQLEQLISKCHFLEIDPAFNIVSIKSDAEKRFLREKLNGIKSQVIESFIAEHLKNPDGDDAVRDLPSQLMTAGHHGDLINRLDNAHFVRLLESERSLRVLKKHSVMGLAASRQLKNENAETRFALVNSVITGLTFSVGTKNEIEARLKLGEKECGVALALAAPTIEERLQLLATAAKAFRAAKLLVPVELKSQLRELIDQVDFLFLGNLASDIACDLVLVDFRMAMDVFEKGAKEREREQEKSSGNTDILVQEAPVARQEVDHADEKTLGKMQSRLSDYHQQRFADAVATLVERTSAENILNSLDELEEKHRLFVLKQWLNRRKKSKDAWKIADYAIDLMLKDLSRPPRLQDFREIAVAFPHIKEKVHLGRLVKRVEVQISTQLALGTTVESVRLEMLLLRAKYLDETSDCELAFVELFMKIHEISEVSVRATCWSWMLYALQKLPDPNALEGRTSVVSEITLKLIESIEELLESSADHYQTARSAIYALARANPELAIQLVAKLNTQIRRDKAFATLASELVSAKAYTLNSNLLIQCVKRIEAPDEREDCIMRCLLSIAIDLERNPIPKIDSGVLSLWRSIGVANRKFAAAVSTYRIMKVLPENTLELAKLEKDLKELWPDIMVDWVRTDFGYGLVRDLADANRDLALDWLASVSKDRQATRIPSRVISNALFLTLKLATASYAVIAPVKCEIDDLEFARIAALIQSIPVPEHVMILWCELGITLHYRGKDSLAKMVAEHFVQPILHQNYSNNRLVLDRIIQISAPFLYLVHPPSASILLEKIGDMHQKDDARLNICKTIFRKRPMSEAYEGGDNPAYDLDGNEVASIIHIVKEMHLDSSILEVINDLCTSLTHKKNNAKIRRTQVHDFLNSLDEIIDEKLPDMRNIQHSGYKTAAQAFVLRARAILEHVLPNRWERLYENAQAIPNVADRVVVMTIVGACAKGRGPFCDPKWFNSVKAEIPKIPSNFDRIDRYSWVAQIMEPVDKQQSVILLKEAMSLSNHLDEGVSGIEKQKNILDIAATIDPTLVDKIIDLIDADEAKAPVKDLHTSRLKLVDMRKELAADPSVIDMNEIEIEELAEICDKNYARLSGGRILPRPVEEFEKLLSIASDVAMPVAFPIWNWSIANAARKTGSRSNGEKFLQNVFEGACHAAELTLALIGKSKQQFAAVDDTIGGLIKPGERDAVFEKIRAWAAGQDGKVIRISDPFFGPGDLEVLHAIAEVAPNAQVRILTSRKHLKDVIKDRLFDDVFREAWNELCELSPPRTEVVVIALGNEGMHPVHDRWIFSDASGLRLGGSTNSMGFIRVSEISCMDEDVARQKCVVIDELLNRQKREWYGEKLQATSFDLD